MTEDEPDFYLSSPLRIRIAGDPKPLRPTLQHEVLAFLLTRATVAVASAEIAGFIWPDPDDDGLGQLRSYISKLRKEVAETGATVVNRGGRYVLDVDTMRIDLLRFDRLLADADQTNDPAQQRRYVEAALLACPRDKLLGEFTRRWAYEARVRHQKRWDDAALRRNAYLLRDGDHARLLDILRSAGIHRIADSSAWTVHYLQALYRCGGPDEALDHFAWIERQHRDRGTAVSDRLRALADSIRRRDSALEARVQRLLAMPVISGPPPNMLPPPAEPLVGRHTEVQAIRAHADHNTHAAVRIVGIYGPPGIGKTALAAEYAHRHEARYPGGVLYADFGAFSRRPNTSTEAVLGVFLGALGISADRIPPDRDGRILHYRDLTRARRLLVVLDNVDSTASVADVLPTGPGSLVLVTSRTRMTTLTSRYGALAVVLGTLDDRAAVGLLDRFVRERPDYKVADANLIAKACDGHPLALCLAGARVATRPEEPMAALAAALSKPAGRIAALDEYAENGDAVADVFDWSYRTLDPASTAVFHGFGAAPSPDLGLASISELSGVPAPELPSVLDRLESAHLVIILGNGRYAMQDLLREYAQVLAVRTSSPADYRAAIERLYAFHRRMVRSAAHRLWPSEIERGPEPFAEAMSALSWLDRYRSECLAAVRHPQGVERPEHVVELAACLFRYLDHGGHLDQSVEVNTAAVTAAQKLGDPATTAGAWTRLGAVLVRVGRSAEADAALRVAEEIYQSLDDRRGMAAVMGNLGRATFRRGDLALAQSHQNEALRLFRTCGDRLGEARTLTNLGVVCEAMIDQMAALRYYRQALKISRRIDASDAVARALGGVAGVERGLGHLDEASRFYGEALTIFRQLGDRIGEATTLTNLGLVHTEAARSGDAIPLHQEALEVFEQIGDRPNTTETLNNLAEALLADGQATQAIRRFEEGLSHSLLINERSQVARSHVGLATAYALAGKKTGPGRLDHLARAGHHRSEAIAWYADLGIEPPDELREVAESSGHDAP